MCLGQKSTEKLLLVSSFSSSDKRFQRISFFFRLIFQQFRAHDRTHARSSEIYRELDHLSDDLLKFGHQFDASWITWTINNDETVESVLCGHSEKLALAYNLIHRPVPSPIKITENLRICGDCRS